MRNFSKIGKTLVVLSPESGESYFQKAERLPRPSPARAAPAAKPGLFHAKDSNQSGIEIEI